MKVWVLEVDDCGFYESSSFRLFSKFEDADACARAYIEKIDGHCERIPNKNDDWFCLRDLIMVECTDDEWDYFYPDSDANSISGVKRLSVPATKYYSHFKYFDGFLSLFEEGFEPEKEYEKIEPQKELRAVVYQIEYN